MILTDLTRRFGGPGDVLVGRDDQLIGEAPDRTFSCPGCARPLAIGRRRCSGCGSLVVAGVLARTALVLVLAGSVVGMIGGALIAGAVVAPRLAAADAALAAAAPTAVPAVVAPPSVGTVAALPDGVAGGLLQVATVNERLARAVTDLTAMLGAVDPSAATIAPLLRKIAADARSGEQGARSVAAWPAAGPFPADVAVLYRAASSVAADGLSFPLTDDAAYAAAGRRMLSALDSLPLIAAATREVASRAGIALLDAAPAP